MAFKNAINSAQEAVNALPDATAVMNGAKNFCHNSLERIKGSGSYKTDLENTAKAAAGLAGTPINAMKACGQLFTLQGGQAACTAGKILKDTCDNLVTLGATPLAGIGTTAQKGMDITKTGAKITKEAAKTAITLPVKGPLKVLDVVNQGIDYLTASDGTSTPVNSSSNAAAPAASAANDNNSPAVAA